MATNVNEVSSDLLDARFPMHEQFPRRITFALVPSGTTKSNIYVEPLHGPLLRIRSAAEDWSRRGDGFRWSPVFNFSWMSLLGWSPVARNLLGLKRRTNRLFEKAEDGARAQMMEEGLTALLFSEAEAHGFYKDGKSISDRLVNEVCWIAHLYEAKHIGPDCWRRAIQRAYEVWKAVRENSGGFVDLDLNARSIVFRPLPSSTGRVSAQKGGVESEEGLSCKSVVVSSDGVERSLPDHERFPQRATFMLIETKSNVAEIFLELSGGGFVNVGSKAEEWSHGNEGFRWHDVFHLANAAVLGWSPVVRALLGAERRSDPELYSREDSLRAQITEEALGVLIFGRAQELGWLENCQIPTAVWWYVERLVSHYEVRSVPRSVWEKAILCGFKVWRMVRRNGGGLVDVDFVRHSIEYRPLPNR